MNATACYRFPARMPYREGSPRPETVPPRLRVFRLRRYGLAWIAGIAVFAVALVLVAEWVDGTTTLRCVRATSNAEPECALVERSLFGREQRFALPSNALRVETASVDTRRPRPTLRIALSNGTTRWMQLWSRNEPVVASWRAFHESSHALRWTETLEDTHVIPVPILLILPTFLLLIVFVQRRARIVVDEAAGTLRYGSAALFFPLRDRGVISLDDIDRVRSTRTGDNLRVLEAKIGDEMRPLADGAEIQVLGIAEQLDELVQRRKSARTHRDEAERAERKAIDRAREQRRTEHEREEQAAHARAVESRQASNRSSREQAKRRRKRRDSGEG